MSYIDSEHNFFGRTDMLQVLRRRVVDLKEGYRQNVAILGNQYVGKSSLFKNFLFNLDDDRVTVIYLDLEHNDFHHFYSKFVSSLLFNFSKNKKLTLHNDLNLLIESTRSLIPHTTAVIHQIQQDFQKGKWSDTFLGLMTLPEIFTNETGQFCVLILDEFQNLEEFLVPDIFQNLGKKIMTQKRCFYVLSSSYQGIAKKILSEKLSLLFGNFEILNLEPFDLQTSRQFIERNLMDIKIGMQLRNFIVDFTGGHPLYLNLLCQELVNLTAIHRQKEIYMPLMVQSIENTIFDRWGVLSRHFELMIYELCHSKGNQIMCSILIALANGNHKLDELLLLIGLKKSQLKQRLNRLLELGIVVKNGNFHYLKDKLFRYWIKYVYQKRIKDVELAPDRQRKQFKEELNSLVETFHISSRKDFPSRIIELFHCFDNESFDINGRKYKLPVFQKFTPMKIQGGNGIYFDVIQAEANDASWLVVIKKDSFAENDIHAILAEAKKRDRRPERCLMISLTDLDKNTRVKALQERFWIWNESELNTLLTLFGQPSIG